MPATVVDLLNVATHDPQGGRFHLLVGAGRTSTEPGFGGDWLTCTEHVGEDGQPITFRPTGSPLQWSSFDYDAETGSLRLGHREAVTKERLESALLQPDQRRGADRDRHGTWYWITDDRRGIVRLPHGAATAQPWWSLDDLHDECSDEVTYAGFGPRVPSPDIAPGAHLAGLAVTTGHYLAVGLLDGRGGVLLFDLHGGGTPRELRWPGGHAITPLDLAATADGGLLVLESSGPSWWRLDRTWRLTAAVTPSAPGPFSPSNGAPPAVPAPTDVVPTEHRLDPGRVVRPVSIVEGPGVVLVLDRPATGPSAVVVCDPAAPDGVAHRLEMRVRALDPTAPDRPAFDHAIVAHDLAWAPRSTRRPLDGPLLYVGDAAMAGVEAYELQLHPARLIHRADELPMRSWQAKALVAVGGDVWFDTGGRWVPLEPFGVCNMERRATFRTPVPLAGGAVIDGQPFDSQIPGCVWHRLFVDAEIPDGCRITVAARASDDPELLEHLPFVDQPRPYLRSGGSELPYQDPWAEHRRPTSPRTGTWELLFQHVVGRFVQLEVTLEGTGRSSPHIRALRAWYPRFSYVAEYLPDVYAEEDEPDRFLERMLAVFEGLFTEHERLIEQAWLLIDARTTKRDALDWLASWVGLQLEPAWDAPRRRFLIEHADRMYRIRGTPAGLRALLRVYLSRSLDPAEVFDPAARPHDPARLVDRTAAHRFRVLIPARLDAERRMMVERIVAAARPAHTAYEVRITTGLLVVGEAQVGLDSVLGESPRFAPVVIGETELATGVAGADHPFDVLDRIVAGRDRLGELPPI